MIPAINSLKTPSGDALSARIGIATGLANRVYRARRVFASRPGNDLGTARSQNFGDPASDPSRRAGHDRYFSAEIEHAATIASRFSGDPNAMICASGWIFLTMPPSTLP